MLETQIWRSSELMVQLTTYSYMAEKEHESTEDTLCSTCIVCDIHMRHLIMSLFTPRPVTSLCSSVLLRLWSVIHLSFILLKTRLKATSHVSCCWEKDLKKATEQKQRSAGSTSLPVDSVLTGAVRHVERQTGVTEFHNCSFISSPKWRKLRIVEKTDHCDRTGLWLRNCCIFT